MNPKESSTVVQLQPDADLDNDFIRDYFCSQKDLLRRPSTALFFYSVVICREEILCVTTLSRA